MPSQTKPAMFTSIWPVMFISIWPYFTYDSWTAALWPASLQQQQYLQTIDKNLAAEYAAGNQIFPPQDLIFNAFHLTPLDKVKVVIIGQDPYHGYGQAMGMSFSVPYGVPVPPSLYNIYSELERSNLGFVRPNHGCLESWAKEGVLMLNATLTVEAGNPKSHANVGWQTFTNQVIKTVSQQCPHVVFLLWGNSAHMKEGFIDENKHYVIKTTHPVSWQNPIYEPINTPFSGSNCFWNCNVWLSKICRLPAINWSLPMLV